MKFLSLIAFTFIVGISSAQAQNSRVNVQADIDDNIKTNPGAQITGPVLNSVLTNMNNSAVFGPAPSLVTNGDIACFNNSYGTLLKDCGAPSLYAPVNNPTFTGIVNAPALVLTPPTGLSLAINSTQIGSGVVLSNPSITGYAYNRLYIPSDGVDVSALASGTQTKNGLVVEMYPNGGSKGNVQGIWGSVWVPNGSTVDISNTNLLGYAGVVGFGKISQNLGGTNTGGGAHGSAFGGNFIATGDTTNLFGVAGTEIDAVMTPGATTARRLGISVVDLISSTGGQGAIYDCAYCVGASGGTLGWIDGILFSPNNGGNPLDSVNGNILRTIGAATARGGIDISSYTFSSHAFKSTGFTVSPTGALTALSLAATSFSSPASGAACTAGSLAFDTGFIYLCTASGAWKRAALTGGY